MVTPDKYRNALFAIHAACVGARLLAVETSQPSQLVRIFDWLEILPSYLVDPADKTSEFRMAMEALAAIDRRLERALHAFDAADVPNRW